MFKSYYFPTDTKVMAVKFQEAPHDDNLFGYLKNINLSGNWEFILRL